jgi:hypothetical protein
MPILRILCYNGSLVTWTVVSFTPAKFKPLIFSVSCFALSYTANMFILRILCEFMLVCQSQNYFTTGGLPPISSSWRQAPWDSRPSVFCFNWTLAAIVLLQHPLWPGDGSFVYSCYWPSPARSFSSPRPAGLTTIFYCLRFGTSLFVASYDSQGHGGGIRPRLHTGYTRWPFITLRHGPRRKHSLSIVEKAYLLTYCLAMDVLLHAYASAGMCLPSHCLVAGLFVAVHRILN